MRLCFAPSGGLSCGAGVRGGGWVGGRMGGRREGEGARGWRGSLFRLGVEGGFVLVVSCAFLGLLCSALFCALFSSVPASSVSTSALSLTQLFSSLLPPLLLSLLSPVPSSSYPLLPFPPRLSSPLLPPPLPFLLPTLSLPPLLPLPSPRLLTPQSYQNRKPRPN
jgi:hypothetical protein